MTPPLKCPGHAADCACFDCTMAHTPETRLALDCSEDTVPEMPMVWLLWNNDTVLTYATEAGALRALATFMVDHPGDWIKTPTGRWIEMRTHHIWRLSVEPSPVLAALPIIHADVASRDIEEAS